MQILVTTGDGGAIQLDVSDELPVMDLKALLEVDTGISPSQMILIHNMAPLLEEGKGLSECGVNDGDIIMVTRGDSSAVNVSSPPPVSSSRTVPHPLAAQPLAEQLLPHTLSSQGTHSQSSAAPSLPAIDWSSIVVPPNAAQSSVSRMTAAAPHSQPLPPQLPHPPTLQSQASEPSGLPFEPEALVQHLLSNPEELTALQQRNPRMAEAILSGDPGLVAETIQVYRQQLMEEQMERRQLQGLDPWSEEYQQRLAENIKHRNIRENMETALEHNPEIFAGRVEMLYLECRVNGVSVKALVDTGAQMTIMNVRCAERCNIMRLVDRRFAGYAFGVGRQKIIGVVHLGQVQIGTDFLASSFRVLEDQSHDIILGLDMLKRHQCIIDLAKNVLRVGTTGNETSFLEIQEGPDTAAIHRQEEQGLIEDEDREMATAIANSEKEEQRSRGQQQSVSDQGKEEERDKDEEKIRKIMNSGFTREQAVQELRRCNGDVEVALTALLAKSLQF